MKISEFTQTEYVGETGLKWIYRQPGTLLGNEIQRMFSAVFSNKAIRRAMAAAKLNAANNESGDAADKAADKAAGDDDDDGTDYQAAARLQAEAGILAVRVCVLSVTGLDDEDGTPLDIGALRTATVELSGIKVKAMSTAGYESLDAGAIGDDIRELGNLIVNAAKMSGAQKKT